MSIFKNFSYLEFVDEKYGKSMYVSAYPTTKCIEYDGILPKESEKIFGDINCDQLKQYLDVLVKNSFGLLDFIWFLKDIRETMELKNIVDWLNSLQYSSIVKKDNLYEGLITSSIDSSYSRKIYIKGSSLPQEALDTVIFFKGKKIMTLIGTKKKSPIIKINFNQDNSCIEIMKQSLYGNVIIGEHLEQSEKKLINDLISDFEKTGKTYMKLTEKQGTPSIRAIVEETGFVVDDKFNAVPYLIGRDSEPGRDPRYWTYDGFGYERDSETIVIAMVFDMDIPNIIPEPLDSTECDKSQIVLLDYALREFKIGGRLHPAFLSHPKLLKMCSKILYDFI
jgi:hypothetical protein